MRVLFIIYDNDSRVGIFPSNIAYLVSVLKGDHEVVIYQQDVYHYPDEHLTNYLDKNYFDVICVGVIGGYYQYKKLLDISFAINESKNRPKSYILGGHGPSPDPGFFMEQTGADFVVIGEGEETIKELLGVIASKSSLEDVKGIAFHDESSELVITEKREVIEDINSIRWPSYESFPIDYYKLYPVAKMGRTDSVMFVSSSRGCIYNCTFCYRMDKGYRVRDPKDVVAEVNYLQKNWRITFINFLDELLMSGKENVENLCLEIIQSGLNIKWYCNGRLNFAKPDILKLMKEAGCVFINYGIESLNEEVLRTMRKKLTKQKIVTGIENTEKAGITPGLNFLFGNIGDTPSDLRQSVAFMLKHHDISEFRTIRPVTPYPGSELFEYAIEQGLLKGIEDFYEKHVNSDLLTVNFTNLSDSKFYGYLKNANFSLAHNHYIKVMDSVLENVNKLYGEKNPSFRGFRTV